MLTFIMNLLDSQNPAQRVEALQALALLEETAVLDRLAALWKTEPDAQVKQVIMWAGKQIHAAKERGYSTTEAIIETFRLNATVDRDEDEEQRKLRLLQSHVNITMAKQDQPSGVENAVNRGARTAISTMALGLPGGLLLRLASKNSFAGPGPAPSYLSDIDYNAAEDPLRDRAERGREPIVPPRPSDTNIAVWVKKLQDPSPDGCISAIKHLSDFNNPASLIPLGKCFAVQTDETVRQTARQIGKTIYYAALYWQQRDSEESAPALE
jgi:hypothetical protein